MTAPTVDAPPPELRLPKRRGVELSLLIGAVLISVYGYAAVGLAHDDAVPPDVVGYGGGLGLLALLAHLAVRFRAPYADPLLLPIAVLLNGVGLVLIYRLDLETPKDQAAPTQLIWSTLGVAFFIAVVVFLRDHRVLQRYAYLSVAAALVLMIVPIFFPAVNGAKIWIRVGGFSFQPGEFAKILLAVFFAAYLAANHNALAYTGRRIWKLQLPTGRVLGPIVAIWLISVGVLVLERDLGTSLLFFGLFVILLYVATGRTGWIAVGLLLAAVGAFVVGSFEPHVHSRVQDWLDPFASIDAGQGPGQLAQSLFAFAAGGMLGTGLGLGHSILIGFAAKSDFILATALRGARPDRADRALHAVRPAGRARLPGRARPARRVRTAARHRPRLDPGAPGVRDRGRGDGADPADGHGDAVPRAGWFLGGHQLDHRGAPDPAQRRGPQTAPRRGRDRRRRNGPGGRAVIPHPSTARRPRT